MPEITLDRFDLALLDRLQRDGNVTNAVLGDAVHLSASQVSRRLQRLVDAGVIAGHAALLDPAAIGLGVTAFAQVILERHDNMLRMVAPDLPAFSELMMKRLLRLPGVAHIKTSIALQKVKQTHVLPLEYAGQPRRPRRAM
mgnify:CR=1 FL=1